MNPEDECSICLDVIQNAIVLPCNHIFCKDCIVHGLEVRQHCPICRRVCCNPIGSTLRSLNDWIEPIHDLPIFNVDFTLSFAQLNEFVFFEKRYVYMITQALEQKLTFIVGSGEFGYLVKILSCYPKDEVYLVQVEALMMVRIQESRIIQIDQDELKYAIPIPIEDQIPNSLQDFIQLSKQLHEIIKEERIIVDEQNIQLHTLKMLDLLNLNSQAYQALQIATSETRIQIIMQHFQLFLTLHAS